MLDERKEKILSAIIADYVETVVPVGSRTISKKYNIGFSSATIRNEMSDLEELGYIMQPHTSAGRIPSDEGYRYYVDYLMGSVPHSFENERRLFESIRSQTSMDDMRLRGILSKMAEITGYPAILMMPEAEVTKPLLSMLELIYLMPGRALMVVVTDDERVEQRLFDLPDGINRKELSIINGILNHYLRGLSIANWHRPLIEFLVNQMGAAAEFMSDLMDILNEILSGRQKKQIMVEGELNILSYPEFQDTEQIKNLLTCLRDTKCVAGFFDNIPDHGISIRIGDENSQKCLSECSMVLAKYQYGKHIGQLALVGPKRMKYFSCVAVMDAVLNGLEQVFNNIEKNEARKNALSTVVSHDGMKNNDVGLVVF